MTTTETSTETKTLTAANAPARINPRIRERRIEVQREAGRKRLRVLLVVSSVLSAVGIAFLIVTSPLLDVDHIPVTGAQHVTAAQVRAASHITAHEHLLFVNTGAAARRIEQLPWIDHSTVKRDFPGTVSISVTEYVPVAYVRASGGVMLVAASGHVIALVPTPPAHTIEVRGVRHAPAAGELLAPTDAAGVVGRLPAALAQRVVAVDVSGNGLALELAGNGEIRLANTDDLAAKAASAEAVLDHLGVAHFAYIDVSTPDRPISHP